MSRTAVITILGAPNAGKSTLLNELVGGKVSIVTPKAQTTRSRIRGICVEGDAQLVFVDTPGIFAARPAFEKAMVEAAWQAVDADEVMLVVDSSKGINDKLRHVIEGMKAHDTKAILVLNKVDRVEKPRLLELATALNQEGVFTETFMISALTGDGVSDLKHHLKENAPEGHWLYPEDQMSDINERLLSAEITREKLFLKLQQELPYSLTVETENWEEHDDGSVKIQQVIVVEREAHKRIIIGKKGQMLRQIGEMARKELEALLERRVHLFLFVKVRERWKEDPAFRRLYGLNG